MKRLLLVGSFFLLSSCDTTTAPAVPTNGSGGDVLGVRYLSQTLLNGRVSIRYVYGPNYRLDSLINYDTAGKVYTATGYVYVQGRLVTRNQTSASGVSRYEYEYDANGKVTTLSLFSSKDSLISLSSYRYDDLGRVAGFTNSRMYGGKPFGNYSFSYVYAGDECLQETVQDSAGTTVATLNYAVDQKPYPRTSSVVPGLRVRNHNVTAVFASGGDSTGALRSKVSSKVYVVSSLYTSVWVYDADGYPVKETRTATGSAGKTNIYEFRYVN